MDQETELKTQLANETPALDLEWLRQSVPIFRKMEAETKQRLASEAEYRKLIEVNNA